MSRSGLVRSSGTQRRGRVRKMTMRGHGSIACGTTNDMPPPPDR